MRPRWRYIKSWMEIDAPQLIESLNLGATKADFAALETAVGKRLPTPFKNFYKIHNGQKDTGEGLIDAEQLLSTERMLGEWRTWKELLDEGILDNASAEPDKGVKKMWFNRYWIPITSDGAGNSYCMDLDPAGGGEVSQIIRMDHEIGRRELMAPTFKAWVKEYVKKLETGEYIYSEKWGGIVDKKKIEMWEQG